MWQLQIIRLNRLKCGIPLSVPQITTAYKVTFSVLTCHVLFIYKLQSRLRPIMFALKPNYNNLNKKKAKICRTWYIKTNPLQLRTNQMSYTIVSKILLNSNFPEPLVSTLLCSSSTLQRQAKKTTVQSVQISAILPNNLRRNIRLSHNQKASKTWYSPIFVNRKCPQSRLYGIMLNFLAAISAR